MLLVPVGMMGLRIGAVDIPTINLLDIITGQGRETTWGTILYDIRLPRVLLALVAGAGLSAAGATWQGLLRNPLADPYLIGVSAGGALGAAIALFLGEHLPFGGGGIPVCAFLGSLAAVGVIYGLAGPGRGVSMERLLLVGVALGSFLSALLSLILFSHADSMGNLYLWMLGGFAGRGWSDLLDALPFLALGLGLILSQLRHLNVLQLGSERARSLGVDTRRSHGLLLVGATLVTASIVATCGMIGFVGLVVPHVARLLVGPDQRRLLPTACLLGANLLVVADLVARTVWAPVEVPVGVLTAMLGAPFFLHLIRRRGRGA